MFRFAEGHNLVGLQDYMFRFAEGHNLVGYRTIGLGLLKSIILLDTGL